MQICLTYPTQLPCCCFACNNPKDFVYTFNPLCDFPYIIEINQNTCRCTKGKKNWVALCFVDQKIRKFQKLELAACMKIVFKKQKQICFIYPAQLPCCCFACKNPKDCIYSFNLLCDFPFIININQDTCTCTKRKKNLVALCFVDKKISNFQKFGTSSVHENRFKKTNADMFDLSNAITTLLFCV